jgi:thioester reductase-like protein
LVRLANEEAGGLIDAEIDALGMMGGYGASKLASEVLLEKMREIANIPLTIFRIGVIFIFIHISFSPGTR